MSARFFLKSETAEAHERLDGHFAAFDLSNRADYGDFLSVHAAALIAVEDALVAGGIEQVMPQWPLLRRSDLIRQDLDALGRDIPPSPAIAFSSHVEMLGALYVLEGSRLGGKLLKKATGDNFPTRYLSHQPALTWPEFVAVIERMLQTDVDRHEAADAANRVFAVFLKAAGVDEVLERDE